MTSDELSQRIEADIAEIMERTGFVLTYEEAMEQAVRQFVVRMEHLASVTAEIADALTMAFQPLVKLSEAMDTRAWRRILRSAGLMDYPPQYNYRQTKRGRVPRLTPAMRVKKREIRQRRGR